MNTKLKDKVELVCHGQALLAHASISISPPTCRGVHSTISTKNPRNLRNPEGSLPGSSDGRIKNMKNKPNFNSVNLTANPCGSGGYTILHPKNSKRNKPNQSQFSKRESPRFSGETQAKIKKMKSKANPTPLIYAAEISGTAAASRAYR